MTRRLGRNNDDADSRHWWETAERAAANRRELVIPPSTEITDPGRETNLERNNRHRSPDTKEVPPRENE
jgi:hypothetical protein